MRVSYLFHTKMIIIKDTEINQNEPLTPPAVVRVMFHFNLSGVLKADPARQVETQHVPAPVGSGGRTAPGGPAGPAVGTRACGS